jgi:hypothetical protein
VACDTFQNINRGGTAPENFDLSPTFSRTRNLFRISHAALRVHWIEPVEFPDVTAVRLNSENDVIIVEDVNGELSNLIALLKQLSYRMGRKNP